MRLLTIFLEFLPWRPVAPSALLWGRSLLRSGRPPLREHFGCSLRLQFIQWNIHKSGLKVSEFGLPADATGPFVLSGYSGYKQVQVPRGRLFAFDSEGNYMLTCSATGGVIYKVPGGVLVGREPPPWRPGPGRVAVAVPARIGCGGALTQMGGARGPCVAGADSPPRESRREWGQGMTPVLSACPAAKLTGFCPFSVCVP